MAQKTEEKIKGLFGGRVLKYLTRDKTEVVINFSEDTELRYIIKGVGQYSFVLSQCW